MSALRMYGVSSLLQKTPNAVSIGALKESVNAKLRAMVKLILRR
jgi:hypothetical protein